MIDIEFDFLSEEEFENLTEEEKEEFQNILEFQDDYLESIAIGNGDFYYDNNGNLVIED